MSKNNETDQKVEANQNRLETWEEYTTPLGRKEKRVKPKASASAEVAHTPGPWRFETIERKVKGNERAILDYEYEVKPARVYSHEGAGPCFVIARIPYDSGSYMANQDEANARLIAAAPELLAALKEALPILNSPFAEFIGEKARKLVLAAIARAEGRE